MCDVIQRPLQLTFRLQAVDRVRVDAELGKRIQLVFDQCQQRRDDDRQVAEDLRCNLVRQRLAGARRQNREYVLAIERRPNSQLLARAEFGVAEALKELLQVHVCFRGHGGRKAHCTCQAPRTLTVASGSGRHTTCNPMRMPKAKRTNAQRPHKDSAVKNTMNPATGGSTGRSDVAGTGTQDQDPKRRVGQFGGAGEPPIMKK